MTYPKDTKTQIGHTEEAHAVSWTSHELLFYLEFRKWYPLGYN